MFAPNAACPPTELNALSSSPPSPSPLQPVVAYTRTKCDERLGAVRDLRPRPTSQPSQHPPIPPHKATQVNSSLVRCALIDRVDTRGSGSGHVTYPDSTAHRWTTGFGVGGGRMANQIRACPHPIIGCPAVSRMCVASCVCRVFVCVLGGGRWVMVAVDPGDVEKRLSPCIPL